jgi:2-oxoglutarate ferredoxin oxidoreductase subunit gamma
MPKGAERDLQVRLSGSGGQGLILSGQVLAGALVLEGKRVAQSQSYEPTSRGGLSRSDLVIGDEIPDYPLVTALDYLLILDDCAAAVSTSVLRPGAIVLTDELHVTAPPSGDFTAHRLPLAETARALGNERATNMVALGALVGLTGICAFASLEQAVRGGVPKRFVELNLTAIDEGRQLLHPSKDDMPMRQQ